MTLFQRKLRTLEGINSLHTDMKIETKRFRRSRTAKGVLCVCVLCVCVWVFVFFLFVCFLVGGDEGHGSWENQPLICVCPSHMY